MNNGMSERGLSPGELLKDRRHSPVRSLPALSLMRIQNYPSFYPLIFSNYLQDQKEKKNLANFLYASWEAEQYSNQALTLTIWSLARATSAPLIPFSQMNKRGIYLPHTVPVRISSNKVSKTAPVM